MLFMLNKNGQSPLDIFVEEDFSDMLCDLEAGDKGWKPTSKIMDESQSRLYQEERDNIFLEARQFEQSCKAAELISMMHKFSPGCSFRFLKEPHRLDLKFERSFTMAIKRNRTDIVQRFPK